MRGTRRARRQTSGACAVTGRLEDRRRRLNTRLLLLAIAFVWLALAVTAATAACPACAHFNSCINSGDPSNNATIVIPNGYPRVYTTGGQLFVPQLGDEFAVFNEPATLCAGAVVWSGFASSDGFTVWGDDAQTPALDGLVAGETMRWRVWDDSVGVELDVTVEYDGNPPFHPNGDYGGGRFYKLATFVPTAVYMPSVHARSEGATTRLTTIAAASLLATATVAALKRPAAAPPQK